MTMISRALKDPLNRVSFLTLVGLIIFLSYVAYGGKGDFPLFYKACSLFLHRQNPYAVANYKDTNFMLGFSYPPTAILLTLWACALPLLISQWAWTLASLLAFSVTVYLWADLIWQRPISLPFYVRVF